jgi:hypothetical protein
MIASFPVCLAVLLGATRGGLSFSVAAIALWLYVVLRMAPRLGRWAGAMTESAGAIPLYLFIVPLAVALLQTAIANPATEFSRSRAIRNSERLIADIERYRAVNGRYPSSLLSVNKDYSPSIIGIKEFHYEASGDAYNLFFEQFLFQLDTREIVMYNPRDQHVMTSHDLDLLQMTPRELALRRGYYAVHDAPNSHWKYFWFNYEKATLRP